MAGDEMAPGAVGKGRVSDIRQDMAWARSPIRRRVLLTYGAFDGVQGAEVQLLRHLASLCDELVVGCTTDELLALRGCRAHLPYAMRRALLEKCRYVDRVIAEETEGQKRTDIVNCNAAIFAMHDQWMGQFDDLEDITQVMYLGPTAPGTLHDVTVNAALHA